MGVTGRVGGLFPAAFIAASLGCGSASHDGESVRVVIAPGSSVRVAAESLARGRVISSPRWFSLYANLTNRDRRIRPGTYVLKRGTPWNAVLESLVEGRGLVYSVTIPEGWEIRTIVPVVAKAAQLAPESLETAARDTALLHRVGARATTLEGYLFPETYLIPAGSTARDVAAMMVREFERRWQDEWEKRLEELSMTRHQVITLASIIEKEARVADERPVISAVYHNRLRRGMLLQADPTVQFALGRHVDRVLFRDLTVDSRYNTYRYVGLPPGPIASPGQASIEAALFPATVPYLYFVAHPDGHHEFRRTLREHEEAARRMRALRREQERAAKQP